jgi:hypothetical protein
MFSKDQFSSSFPPMCCVAHLVFHCLSLLTCLPCEIIDAGGERYVDARVIHFVAKSFPTHFAMGVAGFLRFPRWTADAGPAVGSGWRG